MRMMTIKFHRNAHVIDNIANLGRGSLEMIWYKAQSNLHAKYQLSYSIGRYDHDNKFNIVSLILTKMWTQCVHRRPTIIVPIAPNHRPAFLKAIGIARIPVPSDDLRRCAKAPNVL